MPAVTARALLHHTSISLKVRLILDSGSQKSYISERARELPQLETTGSQSLTIATFGSSKGSEKVCPIVSVSVCLRGHPSMPLTLYVMPTICEAIHLNVCEADSVESGSSMPVLIGSDYYWQLVTGSICWGFESWVGCCLGRQVLQPLNDVP